MKRDMDLIRKILLKVEACTSPYGPGAAMEISGYDNLVVSYHVKLLDEAGLLEAMNDTEFGGEDGFNWWPQSLTWEGHEFLDAARDDNRWKKTKRFVFEKAGSLTFEALKFSLTQSIKSQLLTGP